MWFPIRFPMRKLFSLSRSRRHVRFSIRRPFQRERVLPYLAMAKLGLLIAQVLTARCMNVHLYGRHPDKLKIAAGAGVETFLGTKRLPSSAYDWVVEATGLPHGLSQAIRMVRPRGSVFMKSTIHGTPSLDTARVIVNEIALIGSRCGRFEPALNLLRARSIST